MRTFKIKNGDISINGFGDIEDVRASSKIAQDLTHWLQNDIGYNRFHDWMGASLEDFIGQPNSIGNLNNIRSRVRESLNLYYANQLEELRIRIQDQGDALWAIAKAEPDSILKEFKDLKVYENAGNIYVRVVFETLDSSVDSVSLSVIKVYDDGTFDFQFGG